MAIDTLTEGELKSALMPVVRAHMPGFLFIRHEGDSRHGVPDISSTGCGWCTWWEVKHADPGIRSRRIQDVTLWKLARSGYARYIIYQEPTRISPKRVIIAHPDHVIDIRTGQHLDVWKDAGIVIPDFNHHAVAKEIYAVHNTWKRTAEC